MSTTTTAQTGQRRGSFVERAEDRHPALRERLLHGRLLPPPEIEPLALRSRDLPDLPDLLADIVRAQLDRYGLGLVQLDEPLPSVELLAFGCRLGRIMPETDPAVQPYVEARLILNLVNREGETTDTDRQPFATTALSLHTEGSGRPVDQQPRYIVLMCLDPGDDETAAQTVVVPFHAVDGRLSEQARAILDRVRYDRPGVPRIRRTVAGRTVFSFRDFQLDPLRWCCETGRYDPAEVRAALTDLLEAMYDSGSARGLQWRRGLLAVIDNTQVFHGRTAARYRDSTAHRHLKRLRIVADPADPVDPVDPAGVTQEAVGPAASPDSAVV